MTDLRAYDDQPKYRCILKAIYDPAFAWEERAFDHRAAGLSESDIEKEIGVRPTRLVHVDAIARTIDYTFDTVRTAHPEGRFNTTLEAALYTGKTPDTALLERRHHWHVGAPDRAYVIFSISYTGVALDIRTDIHDGRRAFPEEFNICQPYASEARAEGCDGLAAPSKRDVGSSCCVIFRHEAVTPLQYESEGLF